MLRRLHHTQPESFEFTPANLDWAKAQIAKYPDGRQASAVIPLLWRAQEQVGWVTKPAIEVIAEMLGLAKIRVIEVASFYFMFQLQPVGTVAHIQVCGTTSCMICGAEDLISVCKNKIAAAPHALSEDGKFSWEEVECLGACSNAPMAQIGKDYYEDLTAEKLDEIIDAFARGEVPPPGPQNGRFSSEPLSGLTSLTDFSRDNTLNASAALADELGDTVKRITGDETPPKVPKTPKAATKSAKAKEKIISNAPVTENAATKQEADVASPGAPKVDKQADAGVKPQGIDAPRDTGADDLKKISGVGPKLEKLLNELGYYHFDQVGDWTADEVAWVDQNLKGFKGRVSRDNWVAQARDLAKSNE